MPDESRRPRIAAVILAAGGSSRLGTSKQLLLHDGQALVRRAVLAARNTGLDSVIVVLGADSNHVATALSGIESVTMVVNDDWQSGQASSLRTGVETAQRESPDGVLVMLADQPLIETGSLDRLLSRFDNTNRIVASEYEGAIGAPAVFGREYLDEIASLEGDTGAGKWLRVNIASVTRVPMPEAAVDIDTPSDADALRNNFGYRAEAGETKKNASTKSA